MLNILYPTCNNSNSVVSVEQDASELLEILRDEIPNCTELGIHLNIRFTKLKWLEQQSKTGKTDKECFTEVCKYWLNNPKKKNWSVVYIALTQVRNKTLEHRKYDEDSTGDSALHYHDYTEVTDFVLKYVT